MCQKAQHRLEWCLQRVFEKWGLFVGRKPWLAMLLSLVCFLPWGFGFLTTQPFSDIQIAWAPIGSTAIEHDGVISELGFQTNNIAIFIYKANNNENLLTRDHFQRVLNFHEFIMDYETSNLRNNDCRTTSQGRCLLSGHPVQYFQDSTGSVTFPAYASDAQLLTKINSARNTIINSFVAVGQIFGGTTPELIQLDSTTSAYNYQEARAIKFTYVIKEEETLSSYVHQAIDQFKAMPANSGINIQIWTINLMEQALQEGIQNDTIIVNISIVLLVTYSLCVLGTCHPVGCRALAAGVGVACTMMAYVASYGLCSVMGMKISNMHPLLPFLLLGIGADDMYVITAVADQVNPRMSYKRKIGKALKLGGVSILITTLTDAVAFMLSGFSTLPALRSFAIFAGFGVIFDFLFQISFFAGYLALDLCRQERRKHEFCGLLFCKAKSWIFCCGKCAAASLAQQAEVHPRSNDYTKSIEIPQQSNGKRNQSLSSIQDLGAQVNLDDSALDNIKSQKVELKNVKIQDIQTSHDVDQDLNDDQLYVQSSIVQLCLGKYFSRFITNPIAQGFVLSFFILLTAFASYAATQAQTNFSVEFFIKSDQRLHLYFVDRDQYFPDNGFQTGFFTNPETDLLLEENQLKYLQTLDVFSGATPCTQCQSQDYFTNLSLTSWYSSLLSYVDIGGCDSVCTSASNCMNGRVIKSAYIGQCLKLFFSSSSGQGYVNNTIIFQEDATAVTAINAAASYFIIKKPSGAGEAVAIMNELRAMVDQKAPAKSFPYSVIFLTWQTYKGFFIELIISIGTALTAIFCIVFLFSGNLCSTLLVTLMMGLVDLNLIGLIWYWGLQLNFITMVNLILAIGLAVDYSAHMAHAYNYSTAPSTCVTNRERRVAKVRSAFTKIGNSVFHGAFSTFVAISTISVSTSYVFQAFFRQWFGIILFGMLHAFFLLPVLLGLIGPLKHEDKHPKE